MTPRRSVCGAKIHNAMITKGWNLTLIPCLQTRWRLLSMQHLTPSIVVSEDFSGGDFDEIPDAETPVHLATPVDGIVVGGDNDAISAAADKDASTGVQTFQRRTGFKRALKDNVRAPVAKKFKKASPHVVATYEKFVHHGRNLKSDHQKETRSVKTARQKEAIEEPSHFIIIGRGHCDYKSFHNSLASRKCLDSQVMCVWSESFNKTAKREQEKSKSALKRYVFSCYTTQKLIGDPDKFNPQEVVREFRKENKEFKIMKKDLLHFPVVKDNHWIACTVNLLHNKFHVFDSMNHRDKSLLEEAATNLFCNFAELSKASGVSNIDMDLYTLATPKHPQQKTLYDCGFFTMLFIEHFDAKITKDFSKDGILSYRMVVAANLIEERENIDNLVDIMEASLDS